MQPLLDLLEQTLELEVTTVPSGFSCSYDHSEVHSIWDVAVSFHRVHVCFVRTVHYWINNAGINGGRRSFMELSPATIEAVVKVPTHICVVSRFL